MMCGTFLYECEGQSESALVHITKDLSSRPRALKWSSPAANVCILKTSISAWACAATGLSPDALSLGRRWQMWLKGQPPSVSFEGTGYLVPSVPSPHCSVAVRL